MTFEEKVRKLYREDKCPIDNNAWFQFGENHKEQNTNAWSRGSFWCLENAILHGEIRWIEKYLPYFKEQYEIIREGVKLFNGYKGQKRTTLGYYSTKEFITFNHGQLVIFEESFNLLKYKRLIDHAIVRAKKHPRNK